MHNHAELPLVSVIIPNYNHAPYLQQRIDSVLNQTFKNFEIIILDDASTDNSKFIIEQYRDVSKIKHIVYNQTNSGSPFKQWVNGVALAKGNYIWFAESDDWCEPTLLTYLVEGIEQDRNCVLSYCQSYSLNEKNDILWQTNYPNLYGFHDGKSFIRNNMVYGCAIVNASMAIWRKSVFNKISKDFLDYQFSGDWLFWINLCLHGNVFITGRALNYFRNHEGDVTTRANKSGINFIENLRILSILFQDQLIDDKQYTKAWRIKHRQYWLTKNAFKPEFLQQIKNAFYHPLPSRVSRFKLVADARWKSFRIWFKQLFKH